MRILVGSLWYPEFHCLEWSRFQLGPGQTGSVINAENEPRILQVAALPLERPVFIGNTHLAATGDWSMSAVRRSQAGKIASILRPLATREPLILCGDFNAGPSSSDLAEIRRGAALFLFERRKRLSSKTMAGRPSISSARPSHWKRMFPFTLRTAYRITRSLSRPFLVSGVLHKAWIFGPRTRWSNTAQRLSSHATNSAGEASSASAYGARIADGAGRSGHRLR